MYANDEFVMIMSCSLSIKFQKKSEDQIFNCAAKKILRV